MIADRNFTNAAIAALGTDLGPEILQATHGLFAVEQEEQGPCRPIAANLAYGAGERQVLDLYAADRGGGRRPIVLFVHGGGFLRGDKGGGDEWPNAGIGRLFSAESCLGAVMNYRLAPAHQWPSGGEDVAAAIAWLRTHAAEYGGDPDRIVLAGTSAGAVHIATFLQLRPDHAKLVRGAVLLSGIYGYTPLDERDTLYFGDAALYSERMPREAIAMTTLPLLLACAEFDPPRFQAEFVGLLQDRLTRHAALPRAHYANGHNHYSMAMHLGTSDRRLADEIIAFVKDCCA